MGVKILVIGDSCIDAYVYGRCDRLCPAAPVPVFVPLYRKENRGMAGNVYENVLSLGLECDFICNDATKVVKTRFVEDKTNHMIMRLDKGDDNVEHIFEHIENTQKWAAHLKEYDAVIISDYNKGFVSEDDIEFISSNHDMVFLDTKKLLGAYARNCKFIKINEYEYENSKHLLPTLGHWVQESLIVTLGSEGCKYKEDIYPVDKVEVKDLTGAGDSFLAGLVSKYIETQSIGESIQYANECATKVVQQRGVNTL